jgi:ubiquinone/menaquinone biosynthesis C-methylase UbiE
MFSDPLKNLRALGLREDMIVADLGAGTGFYSLAVARLVPLGKVYTVEVQKDYLETVKQKAAEAKLTNVECLWGNIEKQGGTKIKDDIVDVAIASNVFFQVENKERFIDETKRILKPEGRVLLVDWAEESALGPKGAALIPKEKTKELFAARGLAYERDLDAGEHHYGMIFKKPLS